MTSQRDLKNLLSSIGSVVRNERQRLGFSQEELADRSGLHRTYITDVERGVRNMTVESMTRVASALDLHLSHLLTKADNLLAGPLAIHPQSKLFDHPATPANILIVEDDPKMSFLTKERLEQHGVVNTITVASSGSAALALLFSGENRSKRPDIVLLDLRLPDIDGVEILRRIRADERTSRIPVAVLTASRSEKDFKECVELGVSAFISKPVEFAELSNLVRTIGYRWMLLAQP